MQRIGVDDVPAVKIALIGDSGVGKTTLSTVLSTRNFDTSPIYRPTVGCNIQVLRQTHELQGHYFVELWDVGGNPRFVDARPVCYEKCDGYIFLWDSSMEATYHSLQQWLAEITKSRRAEEAQWASEFVGERVEAAVGTAPAVVNIAAPSSSGSSSSGSSSNSGGGSIGSNSINTGHSLTSTPLPRSPINIFGHAKGAASLPSSPLGPLLVADDIEFSVPLLIVGNKIDKLSRTDRVTLQTACAQQVFVVRAASPHLPPPFCVQLTFFVSARDGPGQSSRTEDGFDATPFQKFFDEVYEKALNRAGTPGTRMRSHSPVPQQQSLAALASNALTPHVLVTPVKGANPHRPHTEVPSVALYTPDVSPQRDRGRDGELAGNAPIFSIPSLSFSSNFFSFSSPTGTSYLRYRSVGATGLSSTEKDSHNHGSSNHSLHAQEKC